MTIQISNFHISDKSRVAGDGKVKLVPHRQDVNHGGVFGVRMDVVFDPAANNYPAGSVRIDVDLTDSFKGQAVSTDQHRQTCAAETSLGAYPSYVEVLTCLQMYSGGPAPLLRPR